MSDSSDIFANSEGQSTSRETELIVLNEGNGAEAGAAESRTADSVDDVTDEVEPETRGSTDEEPTQPQRVNDDASATTNESAPVVSAVESVEEGPSHSSSTHVAATVLRESSTPRKAGVKRKATDSASAVSHDHESKRPLVTECCKCSGKNSDDDEEEEEDEMYCNICMEAWSNTGEHRISSLKCGHFFGYSCIERWLKSGQSCPNCNTKANKRDIRSHFVARLKVMDTSERDRALKDLEKVSIQKRELELKVTTLQMALEMCKKENLRLSSAMCSVGPASSLSVNASNPSSENNKGKRLTYAKRIELIAAAALQRSSREDPSSRDKYCRIMAASEFHGMLVVSQPSFTALMPGFGIRRINMVDMKAEAFYQLHKEPIRDIALNPSNHDLLISASQDKSVKLSNFLTGQVMQRYPCDSEAWSCCWDADEPSQFFVGTKRSQILLYDTRSEDVQPLKILSYAVVERRPIISMAYVPTKQTHAFSSGGLLVLTLGSLWFFERIGHPSDNNFYPHKLPVEGLFWSLKFDSKTRLVLVSTKPNPHAKHLICELSRVNISDEPERPEWKCSCHIIYEEHRGGSFSQRSFLRGAIFSYPCDPNLAAFAFGRGSGNSDHRVVVQEVGAQKGKFELIAQKPVLDICSVYVNSESYLYILSETEIIVYKWTAETI